MRRSFFGVSLVALALAVCSSGASAASGLQQRFFLSPSGNISCELDYDTGGHSLPTQAFCETYNPGETVTMSPGGALKECHGERCLGDPPDNASTLAYGRTVRLGPFSCTSLTSGMQCRLPSGRGFQIARAGITTLY